MKYGFYNTSYDKRDTFFFQPDATKPDIEDMTHWHIYYKCVCAPAGVAFFTSIVITPLPLIKDHRHIRDCVDALKLRSLSFCRGGILILTLFVYGLYYFGKWSHSHVRIFASLPTLKGCLC